MPKISELPVNSSPSAYATVAAVDDGETVQIPVLKLLGVSVPILEPTAELTYRRNYNGSEYYYKLGSISSNLNCTTIVIASTARIDDTFDYEPVREIGTATITGNSYIKKIYIPDSVTTVGTQAFMGLSNCTFYCQATSKPDGWSDNWNPGGHDVVWGEVWQEGEADSVEAKIHYYDFTDTGDVTLEYFKNIVTNQGYVFGSSAFAKIGTKIYAFSIGTPFANGTIQSVQFLDILSLKRYSNTGAYNSSFLSEIISISSSSTVTDVFASLASGASSGSSSSNSLPLVEVSTSPSTYLVVVVDAMTEAGIASGESFMLRLTGYMSGEYYARFSNYGGTTYNVEFADLAALAKYQTVCSVDGMSISDYVDSCKRADLQDLVARVEVLESAHV